LWEFHLLSEGYHRRVELQWLHTRAIMAMINNTTLGAKKLTEEEIKPLELDKRVGSQRDEKASISLFEQMVKR